MATGLLPAWAENPADADLNALAGPMQGATTYEPSNDSLVSGQLERILSKDSPYLTQARTRATQLANRRGLLNSSIAASAGESAAIEAAMPIATQDATTYGNAQKYNTEATNTFARDANAFAAEGALAKFGGTLDAQARKDELGQQMTLADRDEAFRRDELGFRTDSTGRELDIREQDLAATQDFRDRELAAKTAMSEAELASKNAAADADRQAEVAAEVAAIRKQAIDARARLEADPNMTTAAKREAILALGQQATADIQELVKLSGVDLPEAWPEWINELTPASGTTPAPDPATGGEAVNPYTGGFLPDFGQGQGA